MPNSAYNSNANPAAHVDAIDRLVRHAEYLRQINSNQAFSFGRKSRAMNIVTIAMSSAVAFVAFSGPVSLQEQLFAITELPVSTIQLVLNVLILLLVVATISTLIFQFTEKAMRHEEAIRRITEFIGPYSDLVRASRAGERSVDLEDASRARDRYLLMVGGIPPSTDRQFERARSDYRKKQRGSGERRTLAHEAPASTSEQLARLVRGSARTMRILRTLQRVEPRSELWLWGGTIRNIVWDAIDSKSEPTSPKDVDIIYFDEENTLKDRDGQIAERLSEAAPSENWDVHNQARRRGRFPVPASLREAVGRSPETFSAVAIRLSDESLEIIAPHGLDDLFAMVVRPTSSKMTGRVAHRARLKQWTRTWPGVRFAKTRGLMNHMRRRLLI